MMENYENKTKSFLQSGTIAVALKDTAESKEIIANSHNIGYILFHTRKDEGKHLFMIEKISIASIGDVENNIYKTASSSNVTEYALVSFNNEFELMADSLHPQRKPNESPSTRYDAQYAVMIELKQ